MGDIFCECFNLYYIFLVYLAGMKKVATTACVPCTVLITKGKRKSTEQTVVLHMYLKNSLGIIELLPHCHTL